MVGDFLVVTTLRSPVAGVHATVQRAADYDDAVRIASKTAANIARTEIVRVIELVQPGLSEDELKELS